MIDKAISKAVSNPLELALALGLVAVIGYVVVRGAGAAAAKAAAGVVSGDNALTHGTPYQGAGVLGTLGAATNTASGGVFQSIGETFGGWIYDVTHPTEYDASTGLTTGAKTVAKGADATDKLWGPIGDVVLRHGWF